MVGNSPVLAFAIFAGVLALTPGLDTLLVLRTTAVSGRVAGLGAVLGIGTGCLVWAVASAAGVTALLATSRVAFEVLRVAGVAYLLWLGLKTLWGARKPLAEVAAGEVTRAGFWGSFRTGLTTNLLNPKVGVFYLAVMPQFLPAGVDPLVGSVLLGGIHIAEGTVWLTLIVLLVNLARSWLTRPTVRRRLEQLAGVAFVGFGVKLALTRAP